MNTVGSWYQKCLKQRFTRCFRGECETWELCRKGEANNHYVQKDLGAVETAVGFMKKGKSEVLDQEIKQLRWWTGTEEDGPHQYEMEYRADILSFVQQHWEK